jgi:predicted Zn-dependent protease
VLRYARELDQRGDTASAIHFYREGLRLDANNHQAAMRLAQLESQSGATVESQTIPSSSAPYWTAASPVTKSPRQRIDSGLERVEGCTVVIVPVGDVSGNLLDTVGYVIHNELNLPVCISPDPVPIPPYTRKRGLATEPQWDVDSLIRAFTNATPVLPRAPIKFLLITTADIYIQDANYVFSSSGRWGAVLSSARFAAPDGDFFVLQQRTAKQALCAVLKSFDIPASTDRDCVTSYVRDLQEFDAKGNRPDAGTMKLFQ